MEIFAPGSEVRILVGSDATDYLYGRVIMVELAQDAVRYQVAWWDDKERVSEWLETFEIDESSHSKRLVVERQISYEEREE